MYSEANPTAQFMIIQNKVHHEDRLLRIKPSIDNKLSDFRHILKPIAPSKKTYIQRQNARKIYNENMGLLGKIYDITFDKMPDLTGKIPSKKHDENTSIESHPFANDHRTRSLNAANRRKEIANINKGNSDLLKKLRMMKSTIPDANGWKKREKELNYYKTLAHKHDENQQARLLQNYISNKKPGENSLIYQYMQRHDMRIPTKQWITTENETISTEKFEDLDMNDLEKRMMMRPYKPSAESPDVINPKKNRSVSVSRAKNLSMMTPPPVQKRGSSKPKERPKDGKLVVNSSLGKAMEKAFQKYAAMQSVLHKNNFETIIQPSEEHLEEKTEADEIPNTQDSFGSKNVTIMEN